MNIKIADPRIGDEFLLNGLSTTETGLLVVDAVAFDWEQYGSSVDAVLRASVEWAHVVYSPWEPRPATIQVELQRLLGDCRRVGFNYTVHLPTATFALERLLRCRRALGGTRSGVRAVVGYEQGASHHLDLIRRPLGGSAAAGIAERCAGLSCGLLFDEMDMTTLLVRPHISNGEVTNSLLDTLRRLPCYSPPPYRHPMTGLAD